MKEQTKDLRIEALKRFAAAITALNIFGHFYLGFEQSLAHAVAALITAYTMELSFEIAQAKFENRPYKFSGGFKKLILFLLPAHISGLAVSMLVFTNAGLMPVIFATATAILSKFIVRVKIKGVYKHFLNPSNAGISIALLCFPWIGIAQPYQFVENVNGVGDWVLPLIFVCVGSFLNTKFTKKMPLILSWLGSFALQAILRGTFFEYEGVIPCLLPMTGVAFLLFTFYMISDPATTPNKRSNQIAFGFSVAMVYGALVTMHVVFGLFFALFIVCIVRGAYFFLQQIIPQPAVKTAQAQKELQLEQVVVEK